MKCLLSALFEKIEHSFEHHQAFVIYKKPDQNLVKAQFQLTNDLFLNPDFNSSGFIFAPFDAREDTVFFPLENSEVFESELDEDIYLENRQRIQNLDHKIDADFHLKLVIKAIDAIKHLEFKKVVISRKEELEIAHFDLVSSFTGLLQKYPTAMVYCWFHPKIGVWMGATPELLCKVEESQFATMALAGTQMVKENETPNWSEKEIKEQQFVTDFILQELKDEVQNFTISEPYSVKAGKLWHIRTDLKGEISTEISKSKIINKLHPTPAVCGLPKNKAKEFILKNEHYNREFYTGFFGEVNIDKKTELFVNLRCVQFLDNIAAIYIGGGITEDSVPQKELEETIAKSNTIKSIFF